MIHRMNIISVAVLVLLVAPAAQALTFNQCYLSYTGCNKLGAKCMPLLKGKPAVEAAIVKTYAVAPDHVLLLICDKWKDWKQVESFPEFVGHFDKHAKHWWVNVNNEPAGPYSREGLKTLKKQGKLDPSSKLWSGVRMGQGAPYKRAAEISEIFFNVLNEPEASEDDVIL
jgi:hypothetical protein